MRRPFLFCGNLDSLGSFSARSRGVASEHAQFAGGFAHFGESVVEAGGLFGFQVNEELVFPGAAVNRAALDFEQVYSVLGKLGSRPIHGRPWEYQFFIDLEAEEAASLDHALAEVRKATSELRVLGRYAA